MRLGIVSTADINRLVIPGAQASPKVEPRRRREPRPGRADEYARHMGDRARVRLVRGAARGPGRSRPSTSRSRTPCTASGRSARSRQASTCSARSRCRATPRTIDAAFDAAERTGRAADRKRSCTGTTRRRSGSTQLVDDGAIGELRLIRSAFSYSLYDADNIRLRTDVEGGALMDVGCYCVSGSRLLARRADERLRRRRGTARRAPTGSSRARCASPATCSRSSTAARRCRTRDELEAIGSEGSLFLDDPWHCQRRR